MKTLISLVHMSWVKTNNCGKFQLDLISLTASISVTKDNRQPNLQLLQPALAWAELSKSNFLILIRFSVLYISSSTIK